jgi:hypothetical protein
MKRAFIAAAAATAGLAMLAGTALAAPADKETQIRDRYAALQENAVDMLQQGRFEELKQLYGRVLDNDYKGSHTLTLSLAADGDKFDYSALMGHPGHILFSSPRVTFSVNAETTKGGFINMVDSAQQGLMAIDDKNVMMMTVLAFQNASHKVDVQAVKLDEASKTATVTSTITGSIDTNKIMDEMGGKPPMLDSADVEVRMECVSVLKLDEDSFTVQSETCNGGLDAQVHTVPSPAKQAPVLPPRPQLFPGLKLQ